MNVSCFPNNFTPMSRLSFSVSISTIHLEIPVKSLNIIFESFSIIPHIQPIVIFFLIYLLNYRLWESQTLLWERWFLIWTCLHEQVQHLEIHPLHPNPRPVTGEVEKEGYTSPIEKISMLPFSPFHWPKLNHITIASCMIDWTLSSCLLIKIRVLASFFLEKLSLKAIRWNQTGDHSWQGAESSVGCWSLRWLYNLNLIREKTWIITQNERLYTK